MPSAEELSPEQAMRRTAVLDALTRAGWTPDTAQWDAGIATDFVASAQLRRFGAAQRCDYIITSGGGLSEYLNVRWNLPEGEFQLIADFLGLTCGGPGAGLGEVLDALRFGQEQDADDWIPATVLAMSAACPLFTLDEHRRLEPLKHFVTPTGQVGGATAPADPDDEHTDVFYADDVENRLYRELSGTGWRCTPDEMALSGLQETFFVRNGPMVLSVGRCDQDDTFVQVAEDGGGSVRLRIDDLARPQDAGRLIALLRRWQDRITPGNWRELVEELLAAYPKVYAEGDDEWHRITPSRQTRLPASPPPGINDRIRMIGETLGAAGWTPAAPPDNVVLRMTLATGAKLRLDQATGTLPGIEEALVLTVGLPGGLEHPFGDPPTIVLDVFDLASGRGGRDRLPAVLNVITARQHTIDARSLSHFIQALQLCCPAFLLRDGRLVTISRSVPEFGGEPSIPLPRPLAEMDRVITSPGGDTAAAWLERGLAADAEGRLDLALESFDAVITREPDHALAHFQRANTIGPGDSREAGRSYLRCVELGSTVGPALLHYATVLHQCGSREQAADTLRDLTARLPEYGPGWYERALTAVKDGRYDESIEAATHAVRLMPKHGEAFYTRACAHALRGEAESALTDIHRAIEADSSLRPQIRDDEDFAALRDDPRFTELTDPWPKPDPDDKNSFSGREIE